MSDIHQQMRATQKAMLRHLAQTQTRIFESLEKVAALNLKLARAGLEEWAEKLHEATQAAHNPLGCAPALLGTDFEKVLDYGRRLNDILSEAQKNLLSLSEERIGETAHHLAKSVENLMQETRDLLPVQDDPAINVAVRAEASVGRDALPAAPVAVTKTTPKATAAKPKQSARAKPARTAGSAPSAPKAAKAVTRKVTRTAAPRKAASSEPAATGQNTTVRAQPVAAQPAPAQPTQPAPQPVAIPPAAVQSVPAKTTATPAKPARMPRKAARKAGPTTKRS